MVVDRGFLLGHVAMTSVQDIFIGWGSCSILGLPVPVVGDAWCCPTVNTKRVHYDVSLM
jgi:hypothetical protein